MKILAICGSYRKGETNDTLINHAVQGIKEIDSKIEVEKINLIDKDIRYCTNCYACKKTDPAKSLSICSIQDDMQQIYRKLDEADGYIFSSPVFMGHETAIMKNFMERACWVMAKPAARLPLNCALALFINLIGFKGCPQPRTTRKKGAIIIVTSGGVPPFLQRFCDAATPFINDFCVWHLNAQVVGHMYAGAVEKVSIAKYTNRAVDLGKILAKKIKKYIKKI